MYQSGSAVPKAMSRVGSSVRVQSVRSSVRDHSDRCASAADGFINSMDGSRLSLRQQLVAAVLRESDLSLLSGDRDIFGPVAPGAFWPPSEDRVGELLLRLTALAFRDELTGLYNRRGFMRRGAQIMARRSYGGAALVVMFADVDNLKAVNDAGGHVAGDQLLNRAADALRGAFREGDVIGRLSGDEFAVLARLDEAGSEGHLRDRVTMAVRSANARGTAPRLSLSLGFAAAATGESDSLDILVARADEQMYRTRRVAAATRHRQSG